MRPLLLAISCLFILSCNKNDSENTLIVEAIENELLKNLHDPNSYEFVSIGQVDTIYSKEFYQQTQQKFIKILDSFSANRQTLISKLDSSLKAMGKTEKFNELESNVEELLKKHDEYIANTQDKVEKYENLKNNSSNEDILELHTTFSCRANNAYGAKVLTSYEVQLGPDLEVLNIEVID